MTRITNSLTLFVCLLLAAAGTAQAQTEVVDTELRITTDPPLEEGDTWAGDPVDATVSVALCWTDPGGTNAEGGSFLVNATPTAPDWISASISPGEVEITPPMGPTTEAGCTGEESFTVSLEGGDGLQPDTTATIDVQLTATGSEEAGTGTFNPPPDNSTSFDVQTAPASDLPGGEDNETEPEDGGEEEGSPGPGGIVLLAALTGLVLWRRRKEA